jgi:hypothetical protein
MGRGSLMLAWCIVGCGAKSDLALVRADAGDLQGAGDDAAGGSVQPQPDSIEFTTCGPTDGAAFDLLLGAGSACTPVPAPSRSYDRIEVWSALPSGAVTILIGDGNGLAETCSSGTCAQATGASLAIVPSSDGILTGRYVMNFADGSHKSGQFVATICPSHPLCG